MQTNYQPAAVTYILIAITLYAFGPLIMIWAVNTLFNIGLAYSFTNWLAVLALWTLARTKITLN